MPSCIRPARSTASIMATPMRSFAEESGFKLSSFATAWALRPAVTRLSRTSGVWPTVSVMSFRTLSSREGRAAARRDLWHPGAVHRSPSRAREPRYPPRVAKKLCPIAEGTPNISATVAPRSAKLVRTPSGPPGRPGAWTRSGTYSRE